jgi:hypothetical protein
MIPKKMAAKEYIKPLATFAPREGGIILPITIRIIPMTPRMPKGMYGDCFKETLIMINQMAKTKPPLTIRAMALPSVSIT